MSLRLIRARVTYYRSVIDSEWFQVDLKKTVLVGPNEAGKTAVLIALSALNPAAERRFNPVREFPRHLYHRFGDDFPESSTPIVTGDFAIDDPTRAKLAAIDPHFSKAETVTVTRYWDWNRTFGLDTGYPGSPTWATVRGAVAKVAAALSGDETQELKETANRWASAFQGDSKLEQVRAEVLPWLDRVEAFLGSGQVKDLQAARDELQRVRGSFEWKNPTEAAVQVLNEALPKFVYYDNYWRAHGRLHLVALKERLNKKQTEDYDFADRCLLEYLRLSIDELIALGQVAEKPLDKKEGQLDERSVRLNAAGIELTRAIKAAWGDEVYQIRFNVDGDYLRVMAVDADGVELELTEKSLGYQWFFSFYTVFYAQARDDLAGATLLLDEPGLHLHGLKQIRFRNVLSYLSKANQLFYTTHSPFLVGPEELPLARVVEIPEGSTSGTTVSDITIAPKNPASLFPLQHALGYALAQSLFAQQRNLCVEGPTDMWYLQALKGLAEEADVKILPAAMGFVPAGGAQRIIIFATILLSQQLRVATLFDSDREGTAAATLDSLVKLLPKRGILRIGDFLSNGPKAATIEDLLRDSLFRVAAEKLAISIPANLKAQHTRNVMGIFDAAGHKGDGFKTRLAKGFLEWSKNHGWKDLTSDEQAQLSSLFGAVAKALK